MSNMLHEGKSLAHSSLISSAVSTKEGVTPAGTFKETGPLTKFTFHPRLRAALASAYPILPEEGLDKKRTGSIHSLVGPAVTKQRNALAFISFK
jgi:hypothetical protein